jgi:hypothetical protein
MKLPQNNPDSSTLKPFATAPRNMRFYHGALLILVVFLILCGSGLYAYLCLFSQFAPYDDEGCVMMTVKLFAEGHALYDQIVTPYGPMYYAYQAILHQGLKIPLCDNATRITTIVIWIAASLIPAFCAWGITRRVSLSASVYFLTFFYLRILMKGPGHPQELVLLLVEMGVALPLLLGSKRPVLLAMGSGIIASVAILTKVNIGLFLAMSLFLALLNMAGEAWFVRLVRYATVAVVLLVPFVLLRAHLTTVWGLSYATIMSLSIASLLTAATIPRRDVGFSYLIVFAISGVAAAGLLLLFTVANGSTPLGLVQGLIVTPLRLAKFHLWPVRFSPMGVLVATASLFVAGLHARLVRRGALAHMYKYIYCFAITKGMFGLLVFAYAFLFYVDRVDYVMAAASYVTPCLWLALSPFPRPAHEHDQYTSRIILCLVTTLQPLQIFPVPWDQCYLGTVLFILVAAVCLGDVLDWFDSVYGGVRVVALSKRMSVPLILASGVFLVFWRSYSPYQTYRSDLYQAYYTDLPFDAPGATLLHIREKQASVYRWLIANVNRFSDTFYSNTGLNNLYFWTDKKLPGTIIMGNEVDILTREQQQTLVDSLSLYPELCIIFHPSFSERTPQSRTFLDYIDNEFVKCGRFDDYEFRVRKGRTPPQFVECATWTDNHDGLNPAGQSRTANLNILAMPGHVIDRVCVYDVDRRVIVADSRSSDSDTLLRLGNVVGATDGIDLSIPQQLNLSLTLSSPPKGPSVVRLYDRSGRIVKSLPFLEPLNIFQKDGREGVSHSQEIVSP